ncbi:enoyl-CoA hydratase-related protein [Bacillus kwashiorkori]|uniref:enoyl-CoA hydratase-related protein n=1 Tax=Bacillus kwashiorkori TaxID=1522318 RepID=UPI0007861C37|nr:enoyl-CoA hydratase-related protein [Bacillus kwashiorkori]
MDKQYQYIETEVKDSIGIIRLNRPKVLNAINRQMVTEIVTAYEYFDKSDKVKVLMITGNGRAFAAGADIDEMTNDDAISLEILNQFVEWDRILTIKKPIIGAVHGYVLGGGFELALTCDLLFAADNTKFGFPEVNLGVMPGAGGTQILTRIIGKTRALEWLFTGEMMDVQEAKQSGIVNRIVPEQLLLEETEKFAKVIASKPPLSIRLIKDAAKKALDYSLYEGMQYERKNFYLLFASEDQKEGMKAFQEKRPPNFTGK